MACMVIIRGYRPGDEINFRAMIKEGIISSMNPAFIGNLLKEITFQLMILSSAILFIFFGMPALTVCILVIPAVILFIYVATFLGFTMTAAQVDQELSNISRMYMSNAFSCFWVAEAFEPFDLVTKRNHDSSSHYYTVLTEKQFRQSNVDVSFHVKKIVGTVGLLKSHRVEKGAWLKQLCVDTRYRRKGIASVLLETAIEFAVNQGYSCVDMATSEYSPGGRQLMFKKGFELKQMYHKHIVGPIFNLLFHELTYKIKGNFNYYYSDRQKFDEI